MLWSSQQHTELLSAPSAGWRRPFATHISHSSTHVSHSGAGAGDHVCAVEQPAAHRAALRAFRRLATPLRDAHRSPRRLLRGRDTRARHRRAHALARSPGKRRIPGSRGPVFRGGGDAAAAAPRPGGARRRLRALCRWRHGRGDCFRGRQCSRARATVRPHPAALFVCVLLGVTGAKVHQRHEKRGQFGESEQTSKPNSDPLC